MVVSILGANATHSLRIISADEREDDPRLRAGLSSQIGMLMTGAVPLIEQSFAVSLGAGTVSALGIPSRIPAALGGLAAAAWSRAFLPIIAAQPGSGHISTSRRTFRLTAATMFVAAIRPRGILLWAFSDLIVSMLFVEGKFASPDGEKVRFPQGILAFGIPATVLSAIAGRALIARSVRVMHLIVPIVTIVVLFTLNSILVPFFSVDGIAISNVVTASLGAAMTLVGAEIFLRRVSPAPGSAATSS